jgi:hypothetical protein
LGSTHVKWEDTSEDVERFIANNWHAQVKHTLQQQLLLLLLLLLPLPLLLLLCCRFPFTSAQLC